MLEKASTLRARQPGHEYSQQHGHDQRQYRQPPERTTPANHVGCDRAQRNAEQGGGSNPQIDLRHCTPGTFGANQLACGFTCRSPEHRQQQGRDEARQAEYPDVGRHCGEGVGRCEHHHDEDEQPFAFDVSQRRGQGWAEQHDREREECDQLASNRD
ncbi:hypothetical protein D3C84_848220 [compost metagenome]